MFVLIIPGLVVLLVVLVAARSAQKDTNPPDDNPTATLPPDIGRVDDRVRSRPVRNSISSAAIAADDDFYLWESRRIARRGEARAGILDFFGYFISGLAALVALGAFIAMLNTDGELATTGRAAITLGTAGSVLALVAIAAMFFGFGALVRNSSRLLSISAGAALDSFEPAE